MSVRRAVLVVAVLVGLVLVPGCVFYLNPLCTDQIRNGDETDVDCGGTCGKCNLGDSCESDNDCDEGLCRGGTCEPLPCANGRRDGAETDVDCGGGECRKCAGGRVCTGAADCFSGNCVTATGTCFELAVVEFAAAVSYPSGSKTYTLFSGDLDGDGDVDIAAANEQDSTISVFLNNGAGAFTRLPTPFVTGDYPTGGAVVDLNKDGRLDVITADYHGNSVSVLLGTAGGVLGAKTTYPTEAGAETSNLAVGDLDGDTILDVVATNPITSTVSVFRGNANGTLDPGVNLEVGVAGSAVPYSAAIGDFNKDGRNDLAIADVRTGTIIVRLGNGDGTFQAEIPYPEGGTPPYILIARDMNLDGNLDLVCANRGSDDVSVLLGRGDGAFRKTIVSSTGADTGPYSIDTADFNRDGVPDIVTPNFKSSTSSVLIGIGDGTYEMPIDAGATGLVTYGVTAADFNGDQKPDFATANANSNDVTVKLSTAH